jgi:hypothetical protein
VETKFVSFDCRRQNLERQVVQVESALEQKLTEQKANMVGATNKGVRIFNVFLAFTFM